MSSPEQLTATEDWRLGPVVDGTVELQYRQTEMGGESFWLTVGTLQEAWGEAVLEVLRWGTGEEGKA
jgi:hypothetical protein